MKPRPQPIYGLPSSLPPQDEAPATTKTSQTHASSDPRLTAQASCRISSFLNLDDLGVPQPSSPPDLTSWFTDGDTDTDTDSHSHSHSSGPAKPQSQPWKPSRDTLPSPSSSKYSSDGPDDVFTAAHSRGTGSMSSNFTIPLPASRPSCDSDVAVRHSRQQQLENLLLSTSRVGNACLVSPRAGPFAGLLVAVVVTALQARGTSETRLLPEVEDEVCRHKINALRTTVLEWGSDFPRPDVWIAVQSMATDSQGRPDTRKLQTWTQNLSDAAEKRIMDFQLLKSPPRKPTPSQSSKPPNPRPQRPKPITSESQILPRKSTHDAAPAASTDESDLFPLSAMQQLYFRTSMARSADTASISEPGFRFTQSVLLSLGRAVELAEVESAVDVLASRHSMLRARFRLTPDGWAQVIEPPGPNSYRFSHQYADGDDNVLSVMEQAQSSIDALHGPVFAVEHIRSRSGKQLLYLVAHHLVVDLTSWRILTHDLNQLLQKGTLVSQASMPFPNWVDYQSYEANRSLVQPTLPFQVAPVNLKYWDLEDKPNCYGDTAQISFSLSQDVASSLRKTCHEVLRTDASDFFLAALLYSFYLTFTDRDAPTAWKQEQGRDSSNPGFNIDDTVGWFTTLCPVSVPISSAADFVQLLKLIKDTRRAIPRNGVPFFTSRFAETSSTAIPLEIMFNCVDTLPHIQPKAGLLKPIAAPDHATDSFMSDVGPQVGRIALFEVSVVIDETAGAKVEMLYNRSARHRSRIEAWMQKCKHLVLEGVGRLRLMEPELTLADAPLLLGTSYDGISKLTTARLAEVGLESVARIETLYPASPVQQEILVAQGQDADCFYTSATYELMVPSQTSISQDRLCAAWEKLVAAHPALRSIFVTSVSERGLFDQIVLKSISPAMLFLDADDPAVTLASMSPMKRSPSQPKHRLSVCKSFSKTYVRLDASQAICDSTTLHNLITQLTNLCTGSPPTKTTRLSTHLHNLSRDTSYSLVVWKASLTGAEPCVFPRLAQAGRPQSGHLAIDVRREELLAFCGQKQVDLSCVLQLAWALVLRVFVGKDNAAFGYQVSGRDVKLSPDMAEAVGSFATVQPRFLDFSQAQTIASALDNLKQRSLQTSKSPVPNMSEIEHALGFTGESLFNTCLSFDEFSPKSTKPDLQPSLISSSRTSDCDVSLSTMFIDDKLNVSLNSCYMSPDQARNLTGTFESALRVILDKPSQRVSDVDLFTEGENAQLMVRDWESSKTKAKMATCLHRIIQQHSQNRPDDTAVCAWDGNLTYRQVDVFATRLATYLKNLGVGPGTVVPVVLERSLWSPVILLAVLQAGGCFVSLDCQDKATVESTIKQINPLLAVATDTAWGFVNGLVQRAVLVNYNFLDKLPPQISLTGPDPAPDHAACMFFSPGQSDTRSSKGIFFTHASLSSAFSVQGPALGINRDSRVMQLSAFNMDISVVEILCTLFHGGCICVPSANERVHDLGGAVARMNATWSYMTTTIARRIDPASVPSLKTLCFRTRTLHQDIYQPWLKTADVLLAYGAPDVCPLAISVTKVSPSTQPNIIGPPLMGKFWILNPEDPMKLVPIGAIGELAIDSPVLIPHKYMPGRPLIAPVTRQESTRAHCLRTGHRVRYLDGGHIQFLSSMRDEVLMDGYPIVLTDAEQRLRQCLGQEVDVVVDVVTTSDSIKLLAAFIELGDKYFVGPSDLDKLSFQTRERAFLAKQRVQAEISSPTGNEKRLPQQYMPSIFVPLRRFPLSTSLKVKRRRLQRMVAAFSYAQLVETSTIPNNARISMLHQKPLPLTRTEVSMRRVWAGVVGKLETDITSSDRFFDVGGNKFLAAQLILACRQKGFDVSLQGILNGATLTETCQALEVAEAPVRSVVAKPPSSQSEPGLNNRFIRKLIAPHLDIHWRDISDVAEASSHQVRSLERSMLTQKADTFSLVLHFNGPVQQNTLENACEALVTRHPILRTVFAVHACRVYQAAVSCFKPKFQRQFCAPGRLDALTEQVTRQDQDLEFGMNEPATRFTFLDAPQGGRLVVRLSATQFTASSAPLLVRDLIALYEDDSYAPSQPTFFDYMRASHGAPHQESVQFWKKRLDGASMTNFVSHSRPPTSSTDTRTLCETVQVNSLGSFGLSFETVLKAAWSVVLATLSGNNDVVFGQVVEGGRLIASADASDPVVAGPLTHTVPIRVRLPSKAGVPLDFMQHVQGTQIAARPFEWMSTLELVRECTKWAPWTRFSTVVQHRSQDPAQESTTLNIGNTPFTYSLSEPLHRHAADMFVCSTATHGDHVTLSVSFAECYVPPRVAQDALNLLVKTIEALTSYDNITKPHSLLSVETIRQTPKIPLPNNDPEPKKAVVGVSLPSEQRHALQLFITAAWTEILNPIPSSESQMHKARFFDVWGCLLPAQLLAQHLTLRLPDLKMLGLQDIRLSAQDILQYHTMQSQYDLVLLRRRFNSAGFPARRKTVSLSSAAAAAGLGTWASSNSNWSLTRKPSMRMLRGLERRSSMRDLSIKAGDWFRDRVVNQGKDRLALAIQDVPMRRVSIISGWGVEPVVEPTTGAVEIGSSEGPREAV